MREKFERRTEALIEGEQHERLKEGWWEITRVMMRAAEEICGVVRREVGSPWMIGHDEELESLKH